MRPPAECQALCVAVEACFRWCWPVGVRLYPNVNTGLLMHTTQCEKVHPAVCMCKSYPTVHAAKIPVASECIICAGRTGKQQQHSGRWSECENKYGEIAQCRFSINTLAHLTRLRISTLKLYVCSHKTRNSRPKL